jgi:hypothetical protein
MAPNRRVRCSYANAVALAAFAQEELGCRTATKDLIAFTEHTFRRLGTRDARAAGRADATHSRAAHVNWFTPWRWHQCLSAIGTDIREHVHPAEDGRH